jgi:hypothetical protein
MATKIATPRTDPTWRAMVTTAEPVERLAEGRELTAPAVRVGGVRPDPCAGDEYAGEHAEVVGMAAHDGDSLEFPQWRRCTRTGRQRVCCCA